MGAERPDLAATLDEIESALDRGSYRPGPWAAFLREARGRPLEERVAIRARVSEVSDKLHRRAHAFTLRPWLGLALEAGFAALGVVLLYTGTSSASAWLVAAAALVLATALQPLVKVAVGLLLGVRYSYLYLMGFEPRFKMRFGSYLAAPRWRRVLLHLSGTVGSPIALLWVSGSADAVLPTTAAVCRALFALLVILQLVLFALVLLGVERLGAFRPARLTSGGAAAAELRERSAV